MPGWQQDVLQSIGVSLLQPRFDFPAALPGLLQWPDAEAAQTAAAEPEPAAVAEAIAAQTPDAEPQLSVITVRDRLADSEPDDGSAEAVSSTSLSDNEQTTALRFRQRLLRFDQLLMLVDQPALQWAEEDAAMRFFADVYFALYGKAPVQFQQALFNWPPVKQFPSANDRQLAAQTFNSFISDMLAETASPALLSWGRGAGYLLNQPLAIGECLPLAAWRVIQLHPLTHYWQQPASKHLLWQHLQAIREH